MMMRRTAFHIHQYFYFHFLMVLSTLPSAIVSAWSPTHTARRLAPPLAPSATTARSSSSSSSLSSLVLKVASSLPLGDAVTSLGSDSNEYPALTEQYVSSSSPKVGILLLNLGGPETGDDVEGFLYNLFADPDIIRLPGPLAPLQNLIALFISKRRAPKSRAAYESIGGGSPILQYSTAQANLLCQALEQSYGLSAKAYIGMRYWKPYTEDALEQIRRDGIEALVIVPLYPQFSISTSGSSLRVLQEEFSARAHLYSHLQHTVVPSWYDRPGYIQAMADLICHELQQFTKEQIEWAMQQQAATITSSDDKNQTKTTTTEAPLAPLHVLFSAHGVPQSYIEAGDPYQEQIQDCVQSISEAVQQQWKSSWKDANANPPPAVEMHLSYQSRVGPIEWLRPYTDDVLPELGARGVKNLVVVPISFVSEHIETLEEIDMEYRELAEESGIVHWRRCPALNTNEAFIRDLAAMVVQALEEPAQTVTEACVANRVAGIGVELQPPDEEPEGIFNTAGVQGASGGARSGGGWFRGLQQQQRRKESSSSSSSIASTGTTTGSPGALKEKERLNERVAMVGVLITILVELFNGKSLVQMFGHS